MRGPLTRCWAWYRVHPSSDVVLGAGLLGAFLSTGALFLWIDLLVCGAVLVFTASLDRRWVRESRDEVGSARIPWPRRPAPAEVSAAPLPTVGSTVTSQQLRDLSDQDLCSAWRASYVRLQLMRQHPGGTRTAVASIAAQRARYLDELERRHPAGFAAWIAAGARAPSDPSRYLRRHRPPTTG